MPCAYYPTEWIIHQIDGQSAKQFLKDEMSDSITF